MTGSRHTMAAMTVVATLTVYEAVTAINTTLTERPLRAERLIGPGYQPAETWVVGVLLVVGITMAAHGWATAPTPGGED